MCGETLSDEIKGHEGERSSHTCVFSPATQQKSDISRVWYGNLFFSFIKRKPCNLNLIWAHQMLYFEMDGLSKQGTLNRQEYHSAQESHLGYIYDLASAMSLCVFADRGEVEGRSEVRDPILPRTKRSKKGSKKNAGTEIPV